MMLKVLCLSVVVLACSSVWAAPSTTTSSSSKLPIVDLGYVVQQATINETGQYYNFSNIRYAAPPTGNLRFAASIPPTTINRTVNDGQTGAICPQAVPYWYQIMNTYLGGADLSTLEVVEAGVQAAQDALTISGLSNPDPRTTEDCLVLDVITPKSAFQKKQRKPVLVWIYGGGYIAGDKTGSGNPASLIAKAKENSGEGVVFVAMNYRLGLFGWLSGSTLNEAGGVSNAGLYDQRLALEWIQKNIHLFGGDPTRVTVLGESAGGGSIMHQITAFGGQKAPFQKAIVQSPGWDPVPGNAEQEAALQSVISQAQDLISGNVTDVAALRDVDFKTLAGLNRILVARSSPYGSFTFGPTVDGKFVPKMPGVLLLEGKFDQEADIMVGHNANEGIVFTSPFIVSEANATDSFRRLFSTATNETLAFIESELYPPIYDGTYPYTSVNKRMQLAVAELSFTCNTRYLDLAYSNETYAYYFASPTGLHGEDIAYTFFNGDTTTPNDGFPVNATIAHALQGYIANFATSKGSNPNGAGVPFFPKYQSNATTLVLSPQGIGSLITDPTANNRCAWLQQALYA